jgi:hypothetical protein
MVMGNTSPTKRGHGAGFGQQSPSPTRPLELATWPSHVAFIMKKWCFYMVFSMDIIGITMDFFTWLVVALPL